MARRPTPLGDRLADDMAEHGDSVKVAAQRLGVDYSTAKRAWRRLCRQFGEQAA